MTIDQDKILSEFDEDIKDSYRKDGAIYPVIKTQFGVAAGNTRLKNVPEWPVKNKQVKNYYDHLKIVVASNIHEKKTPEWWTKQLTEAAKWLIENEKVPKGQIVERLKHDFPLGRRSIYRYLPMEFKTQTKPEGPQQPAKKIDSVSISEPVSTISPAKEAQTKGIEKQPEAPVADIAAPTIGKKVEPFAKGQSPNPKTNNPAQFTGHAVTLFNLIHGIKGTNFEQEVPHLRENPPDADKYTNTLTKEGHEKSYQTDIIDWNLKLGIEAKGKAHKPLEDDKERAAFFAKKDIEIIEFQNEDIDNVPHLVKWIVELKVENALLRREVAV